MRIGLRVVLICYNSHVKKDIAVYWARRDLRINDNPALCAAVNYANNNKIKFLPLFVLEDYMLEADPRSQFGYPSRVFLSRAVPNFLKNFKHFTLVMGKAARTIISMMEEYNVTLFVNEDVYVDFYTQIKKIRAAGVDVKLFSDALTVSKETKTGTGNIYSVFTPFKKSVWESFCTATVLPAPNLDKVEYATEPIKKLKYIEAKKETIWGLFSKNREIVIGGKHINIDSLIDVAPDYSEWYFSEEQACEAFDKYIKTGMSDYKNTRDALDQDGTSRMSLGLAWGLVSSRMLRLKIQKYFNKDFLDIFNTSLDQGAVHYLSELIWREFYKYLMYHYPELMNLEFQEKFRGRIEWADDATAQDRFFKWVRGETGYPVVDAAMMQLAQTGYMHNRARMIVASVLTKNFGVDWRWGQEYFRAMLIDLDEASNNGGWQWGASVGADPKPIRIFNPYLQAQNYDKKELYQKKYLRSDYKDNPPKIIIEHKDARVSALRRYGLDDVNHSSVRDY